MSLPQQKKKKKKMVGVDTWGRGYNSGIKPAIQLAGKGELDLFPVTPTATASLTGWANQG